MKKVLFVCIHNSARSQIAEAYLNQLGKENFYAESAGIEKGTLNPIVVQAMALDGIDISTNKTKTVETMIDSNKIFDYLITVCDETSAEKCPYYPGVGRRFHMGFEDPSALTGTNEEKLEKTVKIRDKIKKAVIEFMKEASK